MQIIVISNGRAEDLVGAALARALQAQELERGWRLQVMALPLLGAGDAYREAGIGLPLGAGLELPSAGFGRLGLMALWRDLKAGLWSHTLRWVGRLACALVGTSGKATSGLVCVGDTYLLFLAWLASRQSHRRLPVYFLPTAKSELLRGHGRAEYWLMRQFTRHVFPRDRATEAALVRRQVRATYVGNPLLEVGGVAEGWRRRQERLGADSRDGGEFTVGLLPGSRQDSRENLEKLLAVARTIMTLQPDGGCHFLVGLAKSGGNSAGRSSVVPEGVEVVDFPELLARADLVIGLAGSAHEQAAALGIPVIAFPGGRLQYTARFARAQKRLLGQALVLCPDSPEAVARAAIALRHDPDRRARMAAAGRERMGDPDSRALVAIARAIAADLAAGPVQDLARS
ncbi:MAG: hypothetical protein IMX00_10205 [Limnochordales bacterium]|nr:hypothetical protein [Limnochordales bacterium]